MFTCFGRVCSLFAKCFSTSAQNTNVAVDYMTALHIVIAHKFRHVLSERNYKIIILQIYCEYGAIITPVSLLRPSAGIKNILMSYSKRSLSVTFLAR